MNTSYSWDEQFPFSWPRARPGHLAAAAQAFSLHAEKGKCCMWLVNKVEIYFSIMGFLDSKWSNLNTPGPFTSSKLSLVVSLVGWPFLCMQEKGNSACGLLIQWKFILKKWVSWTANGPIWIPQGHAPLGLIHFWGTFRGVFSNGCSKREMLHVAC